jgi:hypothetical protein
MDAPLMIFRPQSGLEDRSAYTAPLSNRHTAIPIFRALSARF